MSDKPPVPPLAAPPPDIRTELESRVRDLERRVDDVSRRLEERARKAREGLLDAPVEPADNSTPETPDARTPPSD